METCRISSRQRNAPRCCCRRGPQGGRLQSSPCREGALSPKRCFKVQREFHPHSSPSCQLVNPVIRWDNSPDQLNARTAQGTCAVLGRQAIRLCPQRPPTLRHASQTVAPPSRAAAALPAAVLPTNHAPPPCHTRRSPLHQWRAAPAEWNDNAEPRPLSPDPWTLHPKPSTLNPTSGSGVECTAYFLNPAP